METTKVHIHHAPPKAIGETFEYVVDRECLYCLEEAYGQGILETKTVEFTLTTIVPFTHEREDKTFRAKALTNLEDVSCRTQTYFVENGVVLHFWTGFGMGEGIEDLGLQCHGCKYHFKTGVFYPGCPPTLEEARRLMLDNARAHLDKFHK